MKPLKPPGTGVSLHNRAMARVFENLGGANGGGEVRVRALLRKFYERQSTDVMLVHFFMGRDVDAIAEKQGDFLLRAMGARPSYSGKPPAEAHKQLPTILVGFFNRRLVILRETLLAEGLSQADADAWVSFEDAFREAIVSSD